MEEHKEHDNIGVDLNQLKKFFKRFIPHQTLPGTPPLSQQPPDEKLLDLKKIRAFFSQHTTALMLIILLVLQFSPNYGFLPWGGLNMRLSYQDLPLAHSLAQSAVYNTNLQQMYASIDRQQPNLPEEDKQAKAREELAKTFPTDPKIQHATDIITDQIRSYFSYSVDNTRYTFMQDIDPYYYLRLADNVFKRGHVGDILKENHPWDTHVTAPLGSNVSSELHPYALAYLHRFARVISPKIPLMQSAAYFPIIMTIIILITLFFIGKTLTNDLGGLVTATFFSLNYKAFINTAWGMAGTKAYSLAFPALFLFFFIKGLHTPVPKKMLQHFCIASFILSLYAWAWEGWWYLLYISITTTIILSISLLRAQYKKKTFSFKEIISPLARFCIFFVFTTFFMILFNGYREFGHVALTFGMTRFLSKFGGALSFMNINTAARVDLWPNVYTSVAELQSASINNIIEDVGGALFAFTTVLGLIFLLRKQDIQGIQYKYGIFLSINIFAVIYATFKGQRFALLLTIPVTIAAAYGVMHLYKKITLLRQITIMPVIAFIFLFLTTTFLNIQNIANTTDWLDHVPPFMTQAVWQSLNTIKNNSSKNAIITSWWDFGHQFSYVADRPVTFDGGSQNTPIAYFLGKILSTSDEEEAINILRMLDCGSYKAYDTIYEEKERDVLASITLLQNLLKINNRDDAKTYLQKQGIQNTENVLKYTHCNPPEGYFITSEDMRKKAAVWLHFSAWNFERAYIWNILHNKPAQEAQSIIETRFNHTHDEAQTIYDQVQSIQDQSEANTWISPFGIYSNVVPCTSKQNVLICGALLAFNTKTHDAQMKINGAITTPNTISYIDETTKKFTSISPSDGTDTPLGAAVFPGDFGEYYAIDSSPALATSMFTRLHYFDGHGLTHFKLLSKRKLLEGGFFDVWKIDWNGKTPNVIPALQTKETVTNASVVTFNVLSWINEGPVIDSTISTWRTLNITNMTTFDDYPTDPRTRVIGDHQITPEIEHALLGMKVHETKVIDVPPTSLFTDPAALQKIGDKTIKFKIRVEKIR